MISLTDLAMIVCLPHLDVCREVGAAFINGNTSQVSVI